MPSYRVWPIQPDTNDHVVQEFVRDHNGDSKPQPYYWPFGMYNTVEDASDVEDAIEQAVAQGF